MAGAGKKRAKAERADRGGRTGGESSTTGEQFSHTAPSSSAIFDGPPPPSSTGGPPTDEGRGRRMSNVPSHPGSRAGSSARAPSMARAGSTARSAMGDPSRRPQGPQLNKNVDYPAGIYNMYSQVSLLCDCLPELRNPRLPLIPSPFPTVACIALHSLSPQVCSLRAFSSDE